MNSDSSPSRNNSTTPLLEDEQTEDRNVHRSPLSNPKVRRTLSLLFAPFTDDTGRPFPVIMGLTSIFFFGTLLGILLPKNHTLPTNWYPTVSNSLGYTYFIAWSVSFYPQVLTNFRRKNTEGLSSDFVVLNLIGFACYATYNLCMFYSKHIRELYRQRYGAHAEISVQSNDVAFAVHAFILCSITLLQIIYYGGYQRPPRTIVVTVVGILSTALLAPFLVLTGLMDWLDYLYILSYMKILVTLVKYVPQVILNYQRQSTAGWSIWQILLDLTGGILSDLQLVLDSAVVGDFSGVAGNLAKFFLGFVSIMFDAILMFQHYILYTDSMEVPTEETAVLADDEAATV